VENGREAVPKLINCGVKFSSTLDSNFIGSTIMQKNADVNDFNYKRLSNLPGQMIRVLPIRRGECFLSGNQKKI